MKTKYKLTLWDLHFQTFNNEFFTNWNKDKLNYLIDFGINDYWTNNDDRLYWDNPIDVFVVWDIFNFVDKKIYNSDCINILIQLFEYIINYLKQKKFITQKVFFIRGNHDFTFDTNIWVEEFTFISWYHEFNLRKYILNLNNRFDNVEFIDLQTNPTEIDNELIIWNCLFNPILNYDILNKENYNGYDYEIMIKNCWDYPYLIKIVKHNLDIAKNLQFKDFFKTYDKWKNFKFNDLWNNEIELYKTNHIQYPIYTKTQTILWIFHYGKLIDDLYLNYNWQEELTIVIHFPFNLEWLDNKFDIIYHEKNKYYKNHKWNLIYYFKTNNWWLFKILDEIKTNFNIKKINILAGHTHNPEKLMFIYENINVNVIVNWIGQRDDLY